MRRIILSLGKDATDAHMLKNAGKLAAAQRQAVELLLDAIGRVTNAVNAGCRTHEKRISDQSKNAKRKAEISLAKKGKAKGIKGIFETDIPGASAVATAADSDSSVPFLTEYVALDTSNNDMQLQRVVDLGTGSMRTKVAFAIKKGHDAKHKNKSIKTIKT